MKTPKEFDYDLWKDEAGNYFIRVKRTGEICEVNKDTFRILHTEAMRMYRNQKGTPVYGVNNGKIVLIGYTTNLSLDFLDAEEMESAWSSDGGQAEEDAIMDIVMKEFCKLLTEKQLDVFKECVIEGMSYIEFAKRNSISESAVRKTVSFIRKKAKLFFHEGAN